MARVTYSEGFALACLRVEVQALVGTVLLGDGVRSDTLVSGLVKNLGRSIAVSPGLALTSR